jgi:Ca-activated chloride channel family protein
MYENNVIDHNSLNRNNPIVPVYPLEGTFMATHPACVSSDAGATAEEAATIFIDFAMSEAMQLEAVNRYGLRSVTNVDTSGSMNGEFGVDFAQPTTIFNAPTVDTIFAVQDVWQAARKDVNLVMLLDVSGSMSGNKIAGMREAASQFVGQMGDEDYLTVITFSHELNLVVKYQQVGENRDKIQQAIQGLIAEGDTALYDAIGTGAEFIAQTGTSQTTNALVVLTDGLDTFSYRYSYDQALVDAAAANDTTVFAIAYGNDADETLLRTLAESAYGNYYQGSEADIAGIYEEMSAAFGGNLGVGR